MEIYIYILSDLKSQGRLLCTELLWLQIHVLKSCFKQSCLCFWITNFDEVAWKLAIKTFLSNSHPLSGEDHYVVDTIVTAVVSITWWTFKLQKPRCLTSNLRVFSLDKATLCWFKQFSQDLQTLVPDVARLLLVGRAIKQCSSLRKRRDISSCLDEATPHRQWHKL